MFVGETGVGRVVQRACEIMNEHKTDDVRKHGGIDLPTLQKYINFHFSVSADLYGQELSTNAATYFNMGIKGRYQEAKLTDDHRLLDDTYAVSQIAGDSIIQVQAPALNAINERLRDDYIEDCQRGVDKWNKIIRDHGIDFTLKLPHRAFRRAIGLFANINASPDGNLLTEAEWDRYQSQWLPTPEDRDYVESLMGEVTEPGKVANWVAPPAKGINGQPLDFDYVRFS